MKRRPNLALAVVLCLGTAALVACSDDDTTPADQGLGDVGADRGQPDAGVDVGTDLAGDLIQWDAGEPDGAIEPDTGVTIPGETCENPIVLTWAGTTIVRQDDTRDYRHDYLFGECMGITLPWEYPNEDLVYRLDFPPGSYHARLVPDASYAYLSIIDVRTSSCAAFESSCTALADSDYLRTTLDYLFTIEQGETVYFVVDSFGQVGCGVEADCNGPFTLTLEEFSPSALGESCTSSWQCSDRMACIDPDDAGQQPGFCTDYCETVDCASAGIPMTCTDVGPVTYDHGSMACVPDSQLGSIPAYDECEWGFECESRLCVFPVSGWEAECRIPCSGSCPAQDETCVNVTADLGLATGADPVWICAPTSSVEARARGQLCVYSYECQGADVCLMATGVCTAP